MFHVSTLLPYNSSDKQQIHRKRRIGNDLGLIIFQESGAYKPPILSQFIHTYYIVSPVENSKENMQRYYKFAVAFQESVPDFNPDIPKPSVFPKGHDFLDFLLTKVINGILASLNDPEVRERIWCKPKEAFLYDLVKSNTKNKIILQNLEHTIS